MVSRTKKSILQDSQMLTACHGVQPKSICTRGRHRQRARHVIIAEIKPRNILK